MEVWNKLIYGDIPDIAGLDAAPTERALVEVVPSLTQTAESMDVSETLLRDLAIEDWVQQLPLMRGSKRLLTEWLSNPTRDTTEVAARVPSRTPSVSHLAQYEPDILWLFEQQWDALQERWPLPLLFPSWPLARAANMFPLALFTYHMFRGYVSPAMSLLYPLSTVFGPWVYIRRNLKWSLSFRTYITFLLKALRMTLQPTGNMQRDLTKWVTLIAYAGMFLVGIVQSFALAAVLRQVRALLLRKVENISQFAADAAKILAEPCPAICADMSGLHALWTNRAGIRARLAEIVHRVYAADVAHHFAQLLRNAKWCRVQWSQDATPRIYGMGHPALAHNQQRNPLDLGRSIIITGPNAAGKSTYMKSVAFNLVLAHSLGVCCAFAASLAPVHMMGCFIRVHDTVGTDSLYQAEVRRCADLIGRVHKCPGRAVLFLDEPMHSTPPTEGAATAMSVCDFLAALPNVTVLATTHYHVLTQLDHRAYFTNISMEAIPKPDGAYTFPYKVRPGASFQCIALELLEVEDLPQEIVGGAIEIKNKICAGEVECLVPTPA